MPTRRAAPTGGGREAWRHYAQSRVALLCLGLVLGSSVAASGPIAQPSPTTPRAALQQVLALPPCEPSGKGRDYRVGDAPGQLPSLDRVPWEGLSAGDTVRIHYRPEPYVGKFIIAANGTAKAPVRICGVPGPDGQRPEIHGRNAVGRKHLDYGNPLHESRAVIMIKPFHSQGWTAFPTHVQIDGLRISGAQPDNAFVDTSGERRKYEAFGACIWIERGHDITIADNEIDDCSQAIFSKSTDDGDFALTRNIRIAGNYMHGNGIADNQHMHTTYIQSVGVIYEFNRYGALRPGSLGQSIKDRSVGTIIRYNRIEDGARAIDLVEAEDFPEAAKADPAYRSTFVYGNQIVKDGRKGSTIHYGGDHNGSEPGQYWGEPNNRKGTLYFYHNTIRVTGDGYAVLFQLSTTEEHASVFNNVFIFDPSVPAPTMRSDTEVGEAWKSGGVVNLGRNWITRGWRDKNEGGFAEPLRGEGQLITGRGSPVDPVSFHPKAGSAVVDAALPMTGPAMEHPVRYQLDANFAPVERTVRGAAADLGAVEF